MENHETIKSISDATRALPGPTSSVWARITTELALLQDNAPGSERGPVLNPIINATFEQNTACAALVFVTAYTLTGDESWRRRALAACESLQRTGFHKGLIGPKWYRLGWEHYHKGCLFTTGTLADAYWSTLTLLGKVDEKPAVQQLLDFMATCRISAGQYAHDSVAPGRISPTVQNTSAIALYLMEAVATRPDFGPDFLREERDATLGKLRDGQRADGHWPYTLAGRAQHFYFEHPGLQKYLRRLPGLRRRFFKTNDDSIYFGDGVHHGLVLYYLARSLALRGGAGEWAGMLDKGWKWAQSHLVETGGDALRFDFEWEPFPRAFRWSNFRDTSTYFLILAALPHLKTLGIETEGARIAGKLLTHVATALTGDEERFKTCIKPYEAPDSIIRFILPRVGEAAAWKGALLAEYLLATTANRSHARSSLPATPLSN